MAGLAKPFAKQDCLLYAGDIIFAFAGTGRLSGNVLINDCFTKFHNRYSQSSPGDQLRRLIIRRKDPGKAIPLHNKMNLVHN